MNLYHVMFDLKDDAKATSFAHALDQWMALLSERGVIRGWRLLRRKLSLSSGQHRDFMLEVEVSDMAELDRAFRLIAAHDDEVEKRYAPVHAMVAESEAGLYRPFPDPERAERVAFL